MGCPKLGWLRVAPRLAVGGGAVGRCPGGGAGGGGVAALLPWLELLGWTVDAVAERVAEGVASVCDGITWVVLPGVADGRGGGGGGGTRGAGGGVSGRCVSDINHRSTKEQQKSRNRATESDPTLK